MYRITAALVLCLIMSVSSVQADQIDGYNNIKFNMTSAQVKTLIGQKNYNFSEKMCPYWLITHHYYCDIVGLGNETCSDIKKSESDIQKDKSTALWLQSYEFRSDNNIPVFVCLKDNKVVYVKVGMGVLSNDDIYNTITSKYGKLRTSKLSHLEYTTSENGAIAYNSFTREVYYINTSLWREYVAGILVEGRAFQANKNKSTQSVKNTL